MEKKMVFFLNLIMRARKPKKRKFSWQAYSAVRELLSYLFAELLTENVWHKNLLLRELWCGSPWDSDYLEQRDRVSRLN